MKRQLLRTSIRGMSLVELMVAITIGLIVLAAVSTVLVNSKASYTTQESAARLQESARFAMHFLTRDLRMAGYYGCADDLKSIHSLLEPPANATDPDPYDFTTSIEAVEGNATVFSPSGRPVQFPASGEFVSAKRAGCPNFVGGKCSGTDTIAVRMVDPNSNIVVVTAMPNEAAASFVEPDHGLDIGDIVLLSDCGSAELFQITNIQDGNGPTAGKKGIVHNAGTGGPPGNATQKFERVFGPPGAGIMKFVHRVYYVGTGTSGHPALWRLGFDGSQREELVEGIEDLQVTFGVDTAGDRTPRAYRAANDASLGNTKANWENVVSARILLKARPTGTAGQTPDNRNEVKAKDFESTILLRNLQ